MFSNPIHDQNEEMKLDVMQRVWHLNRRQSSNLSVFEESPELDLFPLTQVSSLSIDNDFISHKIATSLLFAYSILCNIAKTNRIISKYHAVVIFHYNFIHVYNLMLYSVQNFSILSNNNIISYTYTYMLIYLCTYIDSLSRSIPSCIFILLSFVIYNIVMSLINLITNHVSLSVPDKEEPTLCLIILVAFLQYNPLREKPM